MSKRLLLTFEKMENKPLEISRDITINLKKKPDKAFTPKNMLNLKTSIDGAVVRVRLQSPSVYFKFILNLCKIFNIFV